MRAVGIAARLGVSLNTVTNCRKRWLEDGIDGVRDKDRTGRPPKATAMYRRLLVATALTKPPLNGGPASRWSARLLSERLRERAGIALGRSRVGQLLRDAGIVGEKFEKYSACAAGGNGRVRKNGWGRKAADKFL
jgi:transposase